MGKTWRCNGKEMVMHWERNDDAMGKRRRCNGKDGYAMGKRK